MKLNQNNKCCEQHLLRPRENYQTVKHRSNVVTSCLGKHVSKLTKPGLSQNQTTFCKQNIDCLSKQNCITVNGSNSDTASVSDLQVSGHKTDPNDQSKK